MINGCENCACTLIISYTVGADKRLDTVVFNKNFCEEVEGISYILGCSGTAALYYPVGTSKLKLRFKNTCGVNDHVTFTAPPDSATLYINLRNKKLVVDLRVGNKFQKIRD